MPASDIVPDFYCKRCPPTELTILTKPSVRQGSLDQYNFFLSGKKDAFNK